MSDLPVPPSPMPNFSKSGNISLVRVLSGDINDLDNPCEYVLVVTGVDKPGSLYFCPTLQGQYSQTNTCLIWKPQYPPEINLSRHSHIPSIDSLIPKTPIDYLDKFSENSAIKIAGHINGTPATFEGGYRDFDAWLDPLPSGDEPMLKKMFGKPSSTILLYQDNDRIVIANDVELRSKFCLEVVLEGGLLRMKRDSNGVHIKNVIGISGRTPRRKYLETMAEYGL